MLKIKGSTKEDGGGEEEEEDRVEEKSHTKEEICSPNKLRDDLTLDRKTLLPSSALSVIEETSADVSVSKKDTFVNQQTPKKEKSGAIKKNPALDSSTSAFTNPQSSISSPIRKERVGGGAVRKVSSPSPKRKRGNLTGSSAQSYSSPRHRVAKVGLTSPRQAFSRSPKQRRRHLSEEILRAAELEEDEESIAAIISGDNTAIVITMPSSSSPSPTSIIKRVKSSQEQSTSDDINSNVLSPPKNMSPGMQEDNKSQENTTETNSG